MRFSFPQRTEATLPTAASLRPFVVSGKQSWPITAIPHQLMYLWASWQWQLRGTLMDGETGVKRARERSMIWFKACSQSHDKSGKSARYLCIKMIPLKSVMARWKSMSYSLALHILGIWLCCRKLTASHYKTRWRHTRCDSMRSCVTADWTEVNSWYCLQAVEISGLRGVDSGSLPKGHQLHTKHEIGFFSSFISGDL